MPIYVFRCTNPHCDVDTFEVKQSMTERHEANCPRCHAPAQRVYTPFRIGVATGYVRWRGMWIPAAQERLAERKRKVVERGEHLKPPSRRRKLPDGSTAPAS